MKTNDNYSFQDYSELLKQFYIYNTDNGIYLPNTTSRKLVAFTDCIGKEVFSKIDNLDTALNAKTIKTIENIPDYDMDAIVNELKIGISRIVRRISE